MPPSTPHVPFYVSGWCGTLNHQRCAGVYADTACTCPCHAVVEAEAAPADAPVIEPTVA